MGVDAAIQLVDLGLSLPPTSASDERVFSQLKLVKTDWRHRLSNNPLNSMVFIRMNGDSIGKFQPDAALKKFLVSESVYRWFSARLQ